MPAINAFLLRPLTIVDERTGQLRITGRFRTDDDLISGKTAPVVKGSMKTKQALHQLLDDSWLGASSQDNSFFIKKEEVVPQPALPEISVPLTTSAWTRKALQVRATIRSMFRCLPSTTRHWSTRPTPSKSFRRR